MVSYNFYNFNWVRIDMNQVLLHSFHDVVHHLDLSIYFERKEGHKSLQIVH